MRKPGEAGNAAEEMVEAAIGELPTVKADIESYEVVTVPAASPVRRAVDAVGARVRSGTGHEWFVKVYYPDIRAYLSLSDVADASNKAAAAGSAPALVDSALDAGVLAFDFLGDDWQWGRLDVLKQPANMERQMDARRRIHSGKRFSRDKCIFSDIEKYAERARALKVDLPADIDWMLDNVRDAGKAVGASGTDSVPCHRDGASSNVMVSDQGEIRLVDFDEAGNTDPLHDIGSMLTELCLYEEEFQEAVEMWNGKMDEQVFSRCRLYGIADDIFWGLWGLVLFADSPRNEVEFFKYGQWRLLRARMNIHDRDFERWCRKA